MSESAMRWMIGSTAAILLVGVAVAPPGTGTLADRSCDGAVAARADTTVDAQDPILQTLRSANSVTAPRYPVGLRNEGISGVVIMSFVVDTLGLVPKGGATIHQETRTEFGDAVCANIMNSRFTPLVANGRRLSVRVLNMPTTFEVKR